MSTSTRAAACALFASLCIARAAPAQTPSFDHVFVIVMENHEYEEVIGNASAPYINAVARQYGLATNAYGLTHPSLPNYMALTSGDTFFTDDCLTCRTDAANIADRIEGSGRTWTAYMEDLPTPCATSDSGLYAAHHNPFIYYQDISGNQTRCTSHVVPFTRFATDLSANRLSNFVWITPNLCSQMHDCGVAAGDSWLSSVVPQILQSPAFANSVLFLVWDEGTTTAGGGGHVPLVVMSPLTPAGSLVTTAVTHYDVLRTIEDAWGLAPLGHTVTATALTSFFPTVATPPTDQVIYANDVTTMSGAWRKTPDPSAAAGIALSTPDAGAGALTAPLAAPADFFEASFQARPGARYRGWFRVRAAGDSKWNDSFFVQFSDSVDSAGRPIYRIGTSEGYTVNLWSCSTCQSFGWGWQRNAYWLSDSGDVWFPTGGTHRIRVQVREDGAQIDQIVLSPSTYAGDGPGPVSNDSTIVPKAVGTLPSTPASPTPSSGAASVATNLTLAWESAGASTFDVRLGTTNPPTQGAAGLASKTYAPPPLAPGTTYFWQIVARNSSGAITGPVWTFTTASSGGGLPGPWADRDVGAVQQSGSASYGSGIFTAAGAGNNIWGSADEFHAVYQPLTGDGQIVARVLSLQNTSDHAKAGVMIRETLTGGSRHVILDIEPTGNVEFMARTSTGGATGWISGTSRTKPVWLRLVRAGSTITGSVSTDGAAWTQVGSTIVTMADSLYIALVVTSQNVQALNTASFDNVTAGGSSAWTDQDVGAVGQSGGASYGSGTFTVAGAGADIWGTADAFHFVSRSLAGDGQIVARVLSMQNTAVHAKAGVMIRETSAADSRFVILDLEPDGNVEFMTRSATGGAITWLGGTSRLRPVWLKLARSGMFVTGSVSTDGVSWTSVGTTSVSMTGTALVGLAVTSHSVSTLNTATFDQVAITDLNGAPK